jgi:hypothetical protein
MHGRLLLMQKYKLRVFKNKVDKEIVKCLVITYRKTFLTVISDLLALPLE